MSVPKSARRGRPPKPEGLRRTEVLRFRATPAEADALYQQAIRHDLDLGAYLRTVVFRGPESNSGSDPR